MDSDKYIIIHYAEIALKGNNRGFFEDALRHNIEKALETTFFRSHRLRSEISKISFLK